MRTLLLASAVVVWCGALRQTRRVWRSRQLGSIDNLELEEIQIAEALAPDCARVRVGAIGLNFADVFSVLGLYAAFSERPPLSVAGLEFAGTVEEAGAACGYAVGDRVMAKKGGSSKRAEAPAAATEESEGRPKRTKK